MGGYSKIWSITYVRDTPNKKIMSRLKRRKRVYNTVRWFWQKYGPSALFLRYIVTKFYTLKFDKVGAHLTIEGSILTLPQISNCGLICAGHNLRLLSYSDSRVSINCANQNAVITIGNDVLLNGCFIAAVKRIEIGDSTIIGPKTSLLDTNGHGIDNLPTKDAPIKIGRHAWIGQGVIILKGVTIGDNSIIGAGSVVTKDVEKNTIVAGNPAKKIGSTKTGYNDIWNER
jgi:acetyltransferase-like isoleucine patch superfamily enzyme